jgi:hypothetical protein
MEVEGFKHRQLAATVGPSFNEESYQQGSKFQRLMHTRDVHEYDYISRRLLQLLEHNYINARLRQCRVPPRDIVSWLHRLY